jgi:hypothetical protein
VAEANDIIGCQEYNRLHEVCSVFHMIAFMGEQQQQQKQPSTITIENRTHYVRNFSDHKDQGNHPLQLMDCSVQ